MSQHVSAGVYSHVTPPTLPASLSKLTFGGDGFVVTKMGGNLLPSSQPLVTTPMINARALVFRGTDSI